MNHTVQKEYSGTDTLEFLKEAKNYNQFLVDRVKKNLVTKSPTALVDFGAGLGTFSQLIENAHVSINCIELDDKQRSSLVNSGFKADKDISTYSDDSIDNLYSLNVLEHIEDDQKTLKDIFTKMAPNGKIYLYVPAFQILYCHFDKELGHYRRYSLQELTSKVEKAGFIIKTKQYQDFLGFFAALTFKLIINSSEVDTKSIRIYDRFIFPISRFFDIITFGKFLGKNIEIVAQKVV